MYSNVIKWGGFSRARNAVTPYLLSYFIYIDRATVSHNEYHLGSTGLVRLPSHHVTQH